MTDPQHHRFAAALARYTEAEAALRATARHPRAAHEAAAQRRDAARRAVAAARPHGVTTLAVAHRLRAASQPPDAQPTAGVRS